MYYFKDHINLTNNLQDNIYILRQRQHLAENTPPAAIFSGTGKGQQTFQDSQLEDQMKQNKRTGWFNSEIEDDKQNQEYKDAKAELERRRGAASAQPAPSQASSSQSAPSQASSSRSAPSQTSQNQRGVDITQQSPERIDAMNDPARGGQSGRFGNPNAGRGPTTTAQPVGGGNARPTATPASTPASVTPPRSSPRAGGKPMEIRDMDGNPVSTTPPPTPPPAPSQQDANTFGPPAPSQEDANTFGPPAPKSATPPAAPQREMDNWGQGSMPNNSGGMQNANQNPGTGTPAAPAAPESSPSNASNPILDQLRKTWKDLGTPRYSPKPESASPGVDTTEPQSFGTSGTNNAPGQPYVVPGSQDWNNMSDTDQQDMVARALINNETHKFTGGRRSDVKDIDQVSQPRFSEDSGEGGPSAATTNERSKIANAVIDRTNQAAQAQKSSKFNADAGVSQNDPNYNYSRRGYAQSPYSPEEPKPAEDTRPTSGRKLTYPGSLQDIIDRMQNTDRSKKISSMLKQGRARQNFNRRAK